MFIVLAYSHDVIAQLPQAIYTGGYGSGWTGMVFKQQIPAIYAGGNGSGWVSKYFEPEFIEIFTGGDGAGWDRSEYVVDATEIFSGGVGDGWNSDLFGISSKNLFAGGFGDGWHSNDYILPTENIHNGGDGDGWSSELFAQSVSPIYNGGIGSGWSSDFYKQLLNNIFGGGDGDGWASALREMGPLPVTLFFFQAERKGDDVVLDWATASEQNTAYFEVERSTDGEDFVMIGRVAAVGNSQENQEYHFTDPHPQQGNHLYRLKMVDQDASFAWSHVVLVKIEGDEMKIIAFPNPVKDFVNLKLSQPYDHDIPCQLYDASGRSVMQKRIPAGTTQFRFNVGQLAQGCYIIRLVMKDGVKSISIVK